MSIQQQKINWTGSETLSKVNTVESISITKEEAKKTVSSLQKKMTAFLNESRSLYAASPTNEMSSVILMSENIERELEKLK